MTGLNFTSLAMLMRVFVLALALSFLGGIDSAHAKGGLNEEPRKIGFNCDKGLAPQGGKCKPCGHKDGQPACEPMRKGPQCYRYMENVNGTCRARGGNGQAPYSGAGFDCKPGFNIGDGGKCRPCGRAGQPSCEKMRKGPRCTGSYTQENNNDYCEERGAEGQQKLTGIGFDCQPGFNIGNEGLCTACGRTDQPACEPMRKGDRCTDAYTQEGDDGYCEARGGEGQHKLTGLGFDCRPGFNVNADDICTACGGTNQPACEVMREGKQCTAAYTQKNSDGICEPRGGDGQPALVGLGFECRPGFNWDGGLPGNRICEPCGGLGQIVCEAMREGKKCNKGYTQARHSGRNTCVPSLADEVEEAAREWLEEAGQAIFNTLVPMAFEVHGDENFLDSLAGSHEDDASMQDEAGNRLSGFELPEFKTISVGATAEANFIIGIGVESGFAFDTHNSPANKPKWYGSGSVSTQAGAGSSYGANVGLWTAENDDLEGRSVGLVVDLRDVFGVDSDVWSDIGTQASTFTVLVGVWYERPEDYKLGDFAGFTISPVLGVGSNLVGATYVEATTDQARAIANGTLRLSPVETFKNSKGQSRNYCSGACDLSGTAARTPVRTGASSSSNGTRSAAQQSESSGIVNTSAQSGSYLGNWKIALGGTSLVEEVKIYNANYIITHRPSSGATTRYEAQGNNEYRAANGSRIRFVSQSRGLWISGNGSTSYQMTK